ncbi:MAG: hypothetical protein CM1200mP39_25120 [Dehalococcoidia bacterium]|nr:MAG: hypothetical protein CM1200mP39_25120 [Dehalococcoidia bacterium]
MEKPNAKYFDWGALARGGRVVSLTDGKWTVEGPMYTGVEVSTGRRQFLIRGPIRLWGYLFTLSPGTGIFSKKWNRPKSMSLPAPFKKRIHYRAGFQPLARATICCDGHGVTTSRNDHLHYEALRRPIYPLDDNVLV